MISEALAKAISAFDDAALATIANTGLLRRAQRDVDSGKATLVRVDGDKAELNVDGQTVEIGPTGPAMASCNCPAVGVCRHKLASVIALRTLAAGQDATEGDNAKEDAVLPEQWLEDITLDQARKYAGRPGWRAGLELLEEAGAVEPGPTSFAVTFASLDEPVLVLRGQGMEGIASKASKARRKAYHVAALLAARRHLGLSFTIDEDEGQASSASPVSQGPARPDAAFLEQVRTALADCAQLGFNIAPLPIEERLFELSVSSRADAMPRLATLLRTIAAQMRLRRHKSYEFDASEMLELCAIAYAITHAVEREGLTLAQHLRLAGELRRNYAEPERMELIGCGADLWHSASGSRGITAHFVEPATGEFYSVAMARGAGQDPSFNPREAFRQHALWQSGTMEMLCHAHIVLHNAGIADGGRLASGKDVRAEIIDKSAEIERNADYVQSDWAVLRDDLVKRFGLGVAGNGLPQIALIAPDEVARPQFDELAQKLLWPVRDGAGRWIALTIDHDERSEHAIKEVEKRLAGRWSGMILVKAFQTGSRIELSPVTLFDGRKATDLALIRPNIVWGNPQKSGPNLLAWLQRLVPDPGRAFTYAQPDRSTSAIMDAWRLVLDRLEAGPQLARMLDDKRDAHARRLNDYGLGSMAEMLSSATDGATHLAAAYALLIARQQRISVPLLA